jgi:hypothetical protein
MDRKRKLVKGDPDSHTTNMHEDQTNNKASAKKLDTRMRRIWDGDA